MTLLFVGSDYKGTEQFNRYEEYFKDKRSGNSLFPIHKGDKQHPATHSTI